MSLLCHFPPFSLPSSLSLSRSSSRAPPAFLPFSFRPVSSSSLSRNRVPARDRVIDFGKHKGRMLGTLPSKYLAWVSKNLRARDFEEWAKLADEVLQDPVYRDRIEWESADRVLSGEGLGSAAAAAKGGGVSSAVSELLDISERFGWDNEDKEGWGRVDFELLGTSKGGRIPRKSRGSGGDGKVAFEEKGLPAGGGRKDVIFGEGLAGCGFRRAKVRSLKKDFVGSLKKDFVSGSADPTSNCQIPKIHGLSSSVFGTGREFSSVYENSGEKVEFLNERKVGYLTRGPRVIIGEEEDFDNEEEMVKEKREERRERQKMKREQQLQMLRREVGVAEGGSDGVVVRKKIGNGSAGGSSYRNLNPFPGRGALLDKIKRPPG